ncbi:hypothetical protein K2173_007551 [Erythroxylum novogranatense]|uniref:Uncharacterized protein n=1 Tax=Erythroxylum novogranatense TaxID=1862640 RepID=A0AAV8T7M2_9ROSI|nr:hypothetical protein K2173_007551 [Erythroxylum novogranatense]
MWVSQRVSRRVYWHSVHLPSIFSVSKTYPFGGGHTVNRALLVSLCKTLVIVPSCLVFPLKNKLTVS